MPLYTGLSTTESITAVIDIGSAYTKFGFSGEHFPRCIIPTQARCNITGKIRKVFEYNNAEDLYVLLVDFINVLFFKHGLMSPKDRTVVIVESLLWPTVFRETLAKVLFVHYETVTLLFVPSHLSVISTLFIDSALVVDIGYQETVVAPICRGVVVLPAIQSLPLGAARIHNELKKLLQSDNSNVDLTEDVLEDIKARCCFVTLSKRIEEYLESAGDMRKCPDVEYSLKGGQTLKISGKSRETCCEPLFELDNEYQSIPAIILDAILKCPIDTRLALAENIVIIGGTAMIPGMKARIKEELQKLMAFDRYKTKLCIKTFKFHKSPSAENFASWLGGAIYGYTDLASMRGIKRDHYLETNTLPDWCVIREPLGSQSRVI